MVHTQFARGEHLRPADGQRARKTHQHSFFGRSHCGAATAAALKLAVLEQLEAVGPRKRSKCVSRGGRRCCCSGRCGRRTDRRIICQTRPSTVLTLPDATDLGSTSILKSRRAARRHARPIETFSIEWICSDAALRVQASHPQPHR